MIGKFRQDIAIDLGTANTVVAVRGKGVVIQEPSVVVRNVRTKDIIAIGSEAKKMMGKTPEALEVIRPLRDGVIADFDAAEAMLRHYMAKVTQEHLLSLLIRPRVAIGIPSGVTEVERRAVQSAALQAGAGEAFLLEEPMAAALGSGIQVMQPQGRMIVDIGGGTTEIAVISLGGIVLNRSLRVAGDEFDEAVMNFVRSRYGLFIGEATAEQTKIAIGSVGPFEMNEIGRNGEEKTQGGAVSTTNTRKKSTTIHHVIRGRDGESGLPKSIKIHSVELREALVPVFQHILTGVLETIEETPPELVSDIVEYGIMLAGGSSQLRGLEKRIAEETKMSVSTAPEPHLAVVRGCWAALENPVLLKKVRVTGGLR